MTKMRIRNSCVEQKSYTRTDLASEAIESAKKDSDNIKTVSRMCGDVQICEITIESEEQSRCIGKPIGKYITVSFGNPSLLSEKQFKDLSETIANELDDIISDEMAAMGILICGLGNRGIISDAIGPICADNVIVTNHLSAEEKRLCNMEGLSVASVSPGVVGQTGIETLTQVRAVASSEKFGCVIAVDALAAMDVCRLGSTVQISNTGISPGSGIGNKRDGITEKNVGIPVYAIGVPTVVDSGTLVLNTLEKAGISDPPPALEAVLENSRSFFVTPKETDILINELARLIYTSINIMLIKKSHRFRQSGIQS